MLGRMTSRKAASRRPIAALFFLALVAVTLRVLVHRRSAESHRVIQDRPVVHKHTLTADGLLTVNPDAPHPIFQLIRDAEVAWDAKRARASQTLDEAVAEYRQRYKRAPPLGFDRWWDYVQKHGVQLPDEYDEIFEDIEPFWGIDPHELLRTQSELETRARSVTVEKTAARPRLEIVRSNLKRKELEQVIVDILELVREVEEILPPLRITFSPFDNPEMVSDWRMKTMAHEAAANGTTLTHADMPSVAKGWIQACPPDSLAHRQPPTYPPPSVPPLPPPSPKTFIVSHRDAMDPCMHPSLFTTHGQFLSYKTGPLPERTLVPRISMCSSVLHHDIRSPVPYGWNFGQNQNPDEDEGRAHEGDVPWERKTSERLDWRGRPTGMHASPDSWWMHGHRERLVTLANTLEGNVSVLHVPTNGSGIMAETVQVGKPESLPLAQLNPAWMDMAFTDKPNSCDKESGTCDLMAQLWNFVELQKRREEGQYKFIFDVDGNGWSGRFKRVMSSNALVFKATIYPEWFTSRIAPWVHYIPIQMTYVDLYDAVSFFRVHDTLARRIARAGRVWSQRFWRKEDMTAYLYRLLLEYARVTSLDRKAMDYVG